MNTEKGKEELLNQLLMKGKRLYDRFNTWLDEKENNIKFDELDDKIKNAWIMASNGKTNTDKSPKQNKKKK